MPVLDNIFPVLEDKCSSRATLLHPGDVLAWGDAAQCCSAGACQGERTRVQWYLVVFVA